MSGQTSWFLALGLAVGVTAGASAATVTTPTGIATSSDAAVDQQWFRIAVTGGQTGITADYPRSGTGSALFTGADDTSYAMWRYESLSASGFGSLGTLAQFTSASYDWYRDAVSTNPGAQVPFFGLWVDYDGDATTTSDRSWLFYEPIYQPAYSGAPNLPTNTWRTEAITPTSIMWDNRDGNGFCPLSVFIAGGPCGADIQPRITGNSVIIGVRTSIGNGWVGTFRGATDNVAFNSARAGASLTANFELPLPPPAAVPTVGEWGLSIGGLLLAGLGARRLRRRSKAA